MANQAPREGPGPEAAFSDSRPLELHTFPPLEQVTRPTLTTEEAAFYLNRQARTLRAWACRDGTGPIIPMRVHGRLAWPLADIRRVLGVGVQ